jgi:RNA polymerase sigma-70 factor (ECF subfamily)
MDDPSENVMLHACRRGDPEAWDLLFDRHYAAAVRFVFQLGHDFSKEDVEEICQETFFAVIRQLDRFQGQSRFQTWLFRIAANKAKDFRQRQSAAKRGGRDVTISLDRTSEAGGLTMDPPADGPGPDEMLLRHEKCNMVGAALERLGGPCQEIIELRYFADLSYEELSQTLELNPKTVSSRLSKCLQKLSVHLRHLLFQENSSPNSV